MLKAVRDRLCNTQAVHRQSMEVLFYRCSH
nr:MAG TPA: hypothetical protein [Caudoviricetes sp.]